MWVVLIIILAIIYGHAIWEIYTSPIMPDDYGIDDNDIDIELIKYKQQELKNKKNKKWKSYY